MADITFTAIVKAGMTINVRAAADLQGALLGTIAGGTTIKGVGNKINNDGYDWIAIVEPRGGFVAITTNLENIIYTPVVVPPTTQKKVVKSTIYFDDNSSIDVFPK